MEHDYLIIEEQGKDLVVTGLKDNAPSDIVIPEVVTQIGDDAFMNRIGLTSITIPDGVTEIGEYAFKGCTGLTSIVIPDSIAKIRGGAFEDCNKLTDVSIPSHLAPKDLRSAFSDCKSLKFTIRGVDNNEITKVYSESCGYDIMHSNCAESMMNLLKGDEFYTQFFDNIMSTDFTRHIISIDRTKSGTIISYTVSLEFTKTEYFYINRKSELFKSHIKEKYGYNNVSYTYDFARSTPDKKILDITFTF